jgi:hypothetical protein
VDATLFGLVDGDEECSFLSLLEEQKVLICGEEDLEVECEVIVTREECWEVSLKGERHRRCDEKDSSEGERCRIFGLPEGMVCCTVGRVPSLQITQISSEPMFKYVHEEQNHSLHDSVSRALLDAGRRGCSHAPQLLAVGLFHRVHFSQAHSLLS